MLLLITSLVLLCSLLLLAVKRDSRTFCLAALTSSLFVFWMGILTYIAKKGGFSGELIPILFGSKSIRHYFQYLSLTLGSQGYIVAVGRFLFPFFLLLSCLDSSYFELAVRLKRRIWVFAIIPVLSLIIYIPSFFEHFIVPYPPLLRFVVSFSQIWIVFYTLAAMAVLIREAVAITMPYFRRRFIFRIMLFASLAILYLLYCPQDPAQIYLFYRNDYMWMLGLWYLSKGLNLSLYSFVAILTAASSIVSFVSMLVYTQLKWDEHHAEVELRRVGKTAQSGVNIFIHGIKNELLANRAIIARVCRNLKEGEAHLPEARAMTDRLIQNNEAILSRIESLYQASRHNVMHFVPVDTNTVITSALERFHRKYPDAPVGVYFACHEEVLCDLSHIAEALANILCNGWEAMAEKPQKKLSIFIEAERLWTSFRIVDTGSGIPKALRKRLYEPFSSSKNSATNWGMGMYYVRDVVKSHFGSIRYESGPEGTTFYVLLPRYKEDPHGSVPLYDS